MTGMTAKAYLKKVSEICKTQEANGQCAPEKGTTGCPLWEFGCGIPRSETQINTVIDLVKNHQKNKTNQCPGCGRDKMTELKEIKFCPYCGKNYEEMKENE